MPKAVNTEKLFLNADSRKSSATKIGGSAFGGNANGRKYLNWRKSALDSRKLAFPAFSGIPHKNLIKRREKYAFSVPKVAFFDVDTQFDFINPRGKLFIKGAPKIIANLRRLTTFAKRNNITIFSSVDKHIKNDPEFRTFPAHCITNSSGQKKISGTQLKSTAFMGMEKLKKGKIISSLNKYQQIILDKNAYTVFVNPNIKELISGFDIFYVYGVALDFCVRACCLGLRLYKKKVFLITDATKEVNPQSKRKVLNELREKKVKFIKTKDVLSKKIIK